MPHYTHASLTLVYRQVELQSSDLHLVTHLVTAELESKALHVSCLVARLEELVWGGGDADIRFWQIFSWAQTPAQMST
jgi:hypothetical protein